MRRNNYKITIRSPSSAQSVDFPEEFSESNPSCFSVLKPSKFPSNQRIEYLWKRLRILIRAFSVLISVWKDIQKYGSKRNHLSFAIVRNESSEVTELEQMSSCLFPTSSLFVKVWYAILLLLLLFTAIIVPYRLSFDYIDNSNWVIFETIIDCFFLFDILVTFNTSYYDDQMRFVFERRKITINYLKSWFIIDLVSSLPLQLFLESNHGVNKIVRLSRIPRIIKILRCFRIFKVLKSFSSFAFINEFIDFMNISAIARLFKIIGTALLVVHINACFWHFIGVLEENSSENWILATGSNKLSESELYVACVYFVMQTMATIGFGDIVPTTLFERIYTIFLIIAGVGFYSYIVGNLSTVLRSLEVNSSILNRKLWELNIFSKEHNINNNLKEKIKKHFEMTIKTSIVNFDKEALIKELPLSLKKQVLIHMHKKIVERIFFFQDKDEKFISKFVRKLKSHQYANGKSVYSRGEFPLEVCFISKGRIVLKGNYGMLVKSYIQGSYFGELEIFNNTVRQFTASVASNKVDLLSIERKDFNLILKEFPEVHREMKETAKIREEKIAESVNKNTQSLNKAELTKSKTSNEKTLSRIATLSISRQSWKHFLKKNLGIEGNKGVNWEPPESVWDKYQNYKDNPELSKKFISKNSLSELFERTNRVVRKNNLLKEVGLNRENFAKSILAPRVDKKIKFKEKSEPGQYTPELSECEDRENTSISVKEIIEDLCKHEKIVDEKFEEIYSMLKRIEKDHFEIKAKLDNFFKYN